VIVDFHTHVFPPEVIEERERFLTYEATFAELYGSPKAKLAAADDLRRSMDEAEIDVSVALGFAWQDVDICRRHNDCLLETAAKSGGRIVAFCTLPLAAGAEAVAKEAERCAAGGARGFGELRPESLGVDLDDPALGEALKSAAGSERVLLFHVSEPVGHAYPGKQGLALDAFYRFVQAHPETKVVGAHWGGGLPFYAFMPEVRLALTNTCFDTAGTSLLYTPDIYERAVDLVGAGSIVFGSDFPLLSQARSRKRIEDAGLDEAAREAILGRNAARLLGLE
jgi:predicted TIM-barrel fold metal-dependent hydrolase